jgi:hypothetical protein
MHGDIGIQNFLAGTRESRSNEGEDFTVSTIRRTEQKEISPSFLGLVVLEKFAG